VHGIDEHVDARETARPERSPPPVIVLRTEMEVAEQYRCLRARQQHDEIDEEQEAEHVVDLVRPDAVQDEEELDEDATEREDAAHEDAWEWSRVDALLRDLARDLVRTHRDLDWWLLESEVCTEERERNRDSKPEGKQRDQRAEGDSSRGVLHPQRQIENEENPEDQSREQERGENDVGFPSFAAHRFVDSG